MITKEQIPDVMGHNAYDLSHKKIGRVEHIYFDTQTGQPEWLTIRTGLFGTRETFVPLSTAEIEGDEVVVPFTKDQIKNAPMIDLEGGEILPEDEEARVYEYYGMGYQPAAGGTAADDAMTRSEEELRVGKETREVGRARLRKYVVTEEQQITVPVTHEEVRVEREPITSENVDQATAGPDISEAEYEVTLHEERPVVGKETKPVERVRLAKDEVTEQQTVRGQVRKERIEAEGIDEDEQ